MVAKSVTSNAETSAAVPVFITRDPGAPAFWDERFEQGYMPWDQQGVPPAFAEFAARLAPCRVLIPGCGTAYEAGWLAARDWNVTAIDFSREAVQAARVHLAGVEKGDAVTLKEVDFFAFKPASPPQWIYERAFLCALPPAKRVEYARHMAELTAPGSLLAGLFFLGETSVKPPFAIGEAELHALLTPYFECIEEYAVSDSLAAFAAGRERWMTWRRLA